MRRRLFFFLLPFGLTFVFLLLLFHSEPTSARSRVARAGYGWDAAAALIPLNNNIYNAGRITVYNQAIFGPLCQTRMGDAFSPFTSVFRPPDYYTNPNYDPQHFSYRYRIDIPPDYELRANSTIVRVELFDAETHNELPAPNNTYAITHSAAYVGQGNPPVSTGQCSTPWLSTQYNPCVLITNESDALNPFWFVRVDENRYVQGSSCYDNGPYQPNYNTETAYDLYYYQHNGTTATPQPIATYMGRKDNNHDTDLRWVSPGAAQAYDQPLFVPVTSGPGTFEVDLETLGNIAADPETGVRSLYLDVTALSGASENSFDIWAGPPAYTGPTDPDDACLGGVPSDVNGRNLHIINCDYDAHDSDGVTVYAVENWVTNYNTGTPIEQRVVYVGPEYAGHSLYIHLFDSDIGTLTPIVFFFDTLAYQLQNPVPTPPADPTDLAMTDWYRAFAVNNTLTNDPDLLPGQSRNCYPGTCSNLWITPPYRIDVPTLSPDCVDIQTTPQLCTPFHGGWLMLRYIPARTETVTWRVELPELPPENTVDSCPAFPITFPEDVISMSEADYNTVLTTNPTDMYPATPAPYGSFYYHTPGHGLERGLDEAQPGDIFLLGGEGWNEAYSFLKWNVDPICPGCNDENLRLQNSLTWPGDSLDPVLGFHDVSNRSDTNLQAGDRVAVSAAPGSAVTTQLVGHIDRGRVLRLLVWNESDIIQGGGPGNSDIAYYKVAQFATFRVLGFHASTPAENWLLVEFMGWDDLCGRPGPDLAFTQNSYQVGEVGMGISLTVTLSAVYSETVTVAYQTQDHTAVAGQDYAAASGTLTFTPGTLTQAIPLTILTDLDIEGNETFSVTLANPLNANIMGINPVPVTILDDENPPLISFTVSSLAVGEGSGLATVVVQQNGTYTGTVTVNYETIPGSAAAPDDYTPTTGTLVFGSGVLTQTIHIPILNDTLQEADESFTLQLSGAVNGIVVGTNPLPITILDNDTPGALRFAAATATVAEGDSQVQVIVTQEGAQDIVTVDYTTSSGNAAAGQDYTPISGTLIFPLGVTTQTLTIPILEDILLENEETFFVTLANPVNGIIQSTNPITVTIMDNEDPAHISFVAAALTVAETNDQAIITLQQDANNAVPVRVSYATSNGTATSGQDYTISSGTVTFPAGVVTQTLTIPILNDTLLEGDENFFVTLASPVNGVITGTNPLSITIADDEEVAEIRFAAANITVFENTTFAEVVVQHNGAHTSPLQVSYMTSNGTATAGQDYIASNGVLVFGSNLTQTLTIPLSNDSLLEGDEFFLLTLVNPVNGEIMGTNPITITIVDDETTAALQFVASALTVAEDGGSVRVVVQQNGVHDSPVAVNVATSNGTASAGQDYTAISDTLLFAPGVLTQTLVIPLLEDALLEGSETFYITLSEPVNGIIIGANPLVVTIEDNEQLAHIQFAAATVTVSENEGFAEWVIQHNGAHSNPVQVDYTTSNGSAAAGQDYTASSGTVVFGSGLTATLTIPLNDDTLLEGNETFFVTLSNPMNGFISGTNPLTITIADNENEAQIGFAAATLIVTEDEAAVQVVVQQNNVHSSPIQVQIAASNGTATAGQDYTAVSDTLLFASDVLTQTLTIPILNDTLLENGETFFVTLYNPVNAVITGTNPLPITIMDDEEVAEIRFAAATVTVSENATFAEVVVQHNGAHTSPLQVNYATSNGTANAGQDYATSSGTLTFGPGLTTTLTIPILDDTLLEGNETFVVTLANPVNGVIIGTNPLPITITDDEEMAEISFAAATITVFENATFAEVVVQHNGAHTSPLQVSYTTSNGTANAGQDYIASNGVLVFGSSLTQTLTIPLNNDNLLEGDEFFFLTLANPVNGEIVGTNPMTITIADDETTAALQFVVSSLTIAEDGNNVQVVVQQNGVHSSPVAVDVATSNGTASAGQDYTAISATLLFAPDVLTRTLIIPILNDTLLENNESFFVTLSNPVNGVIMGPNPIIITIEDNEELAQISFVATTVSVPETAEQVQVVIQQNQAHTSPLTIYFSTSNGTATAGQDYTPNGGTVNFNGAAAITVTIQLNNDTIPEGNETFFITLANPVNGTLVGSNPLQVIIRDDECLFAPSSAPGRIEAEDFACGGEGVGYHDSTPGNAGTSDYRFAEDVDVWDRAAASQTHYVGSTAVGEWLAYSVVVTEAGRYDVSLAAASLTSSQVRIVVDGVDVTGALTLPATGGATHFVEVAAAAGLQLSAGTHQIRLFIITGGANLDYLLLTPSATPTLYLPFMVKP